ncbi:hypothetical protein H0G86_003262 [Trichoderma simmonsii]|uniref:Uncharacterized protein n=1 Tax=Trichoderma simmonsii TaxID=1491479 RepID=A0A8G0L7C9_9HYPO|nr:hypothetical protein H0G86_003262 [Trichoderma simmonsii]
MPSLHTQHDIICPNPPTHNKHPAASCRRRFTSWKKREQDGVYLTNGIHLFTYRSETGPLRRVALRKGSQYRNSSINSQRFLAMNQVQDTQGYLNLLYGGTWPFRYSKTT